MSDIGIYPIIQIVIYDNDPRFDPLILKVYPTMWYDGEYRHNMGRYINVNHPELLRCIFFYARNFIKGRWPEVERLMLREAAWAFHYANEIIQARWPEAEEVIAKEPIWWTHYKKYVIEHRREERMRPPLIYDPLLSKQGD